MAVVGWEEQIYMDEATMCRGRDGKREVRSAPSIRPNFKREKRMMRLL